jgi:hypothetical protein
MNKESQQHAAVPSYGSPRTPVQRTVATLNRDDSDVFASPVSSKISSTFDRGREERNDNQDDSPLKGFDRLGTQEEKTARKGKSLFQRKVASMMLSTTQKHPQFFPKEKALVLPKGIFEEDNVMGCMFFAFAEELHLEVYTYEGEAEFSRNFDEKFAIGLYFGATSNQIVNLNRSKSGYELGKAHAFAQRVKKFFAHTPELGEEALIRDNFFFGNNPSEKTASGQEVCFDLKRRFIGLFKEDQNAHHLYSVYLSCLSLFELNGFEEEEINKIIHNHIIKIDDMIRTTFRTEYSKKKGKTVLSAVRKPNLPARSPLFLQAEMNLVHKLLSPFWDSLADLKRDYELRVFECGFASLKKQITDLYQLRWGILSKFAKVTTKRLQAIRKMTGAEKLKKQEVTDVQLRAFIDTRGAKVFNFQDELADIIPTNGLIKAVGGLNKGSPTDDSQAKLLIAAECALGYQSIGYKLAERPSAESEITKLTQVESAVNRLTHLRLKSGQVKQIASRSTNIKPHAVPGYVMNLSGQIGNLIDLIDQTRRLPQEVLEYAGRTLEPPILFPGEYMKSISEGIEKAKGRIRENFSARRNYVAPELQKLFEAALKNLL